MKNTIKILPIFILLLSSCSSKPTTSKNSDKTDGNSSLSIDGTSDSETSDSETSGSEETKERADERDYDYENCLVKPSETVSNIDELEAIVDYYAFYKVENFTVTLSNYVYSTEFETIESELNYLYWHSELVNGVMGFNAEWSSADTWEFTYIFYKNAYKDSKPYFEKWTDLSYQTPTSDRTSDYDSFATDDNSKPICDVATTQQLWYAAEHGYKVNPLPDSPAEKYYGMAKDLLRQIVSNSDSDLEKYSKIYDYIHENSTYDYSAAYESESAPNPTLYPDEYCSGDKCYFIEGFFDNHLVVCDGFAKIYTLLGRMEGLEIYRASGTNDLSWTTREVPGHAYCFLNYNNECFLSDLTWGQLQTNDDHRSCNYQRYFLAPHSYISPYCSTEWQDLHVKEYFDDTKYFDAIGSTFAKYTITSNSKTHSCLMTNDDIETSYLDDILSALEGKTKSYINFYVIGEDAIYAAYYKIANSEYCGAYFADLDFNNYAAEFLVMAE